MTDKEIVKAFDILQKFDFFHGQRAGRELWNEKPTDVQNEDVRKFSEDVAFLMDFINRQKEKIEQLQTALFKCGEEMAEKQATISRRMDEIDMMFTKFETIAAEAVKEFAERLKKELSFGRYTDAERIDNLVKEFTEGENT